MKSDIWLTPPEIIKSLGDFDLDPCSPVNRPWDTAKHHFNEHDNGLMQNWEGRVWMNPPYGAHTKHWLNKLAMHKNGTALIFARTDTSMFFNYVWEAAESLLFIKGRLKFHLPDGTQIGTNAGAPSVLIAYDEFNAEMMDISGIQGKHVYLKSNFFVVGLASDDRSWKVIVGEAVRNNNGVATLNDVYDTVIDIAPSRVKRNKHFKAKIRQVLQSHFVRVDRGTYAEN